jgi:hypothetical protein
MGEQADEPVMMARHQSLDSPGATSDIALPWRSIGLVTTLIGVVLGVLGPFGSYLNDGLMLRVLYWIGAAWAGLLIYGLGWRLGGRLGGRRRVARWAAMALTVAIASVAQTVLTRATALWLWPELAAVAPGWGLWYCQVLAVAVIFVLATALLLNVTMPRAAAAATDVSEPIPTPFDGDVMALEMEDHYVRVYRPGGSELVLMPLTRAMIAVAAIDGLRTHRSWWVARDAVERIEGTPRSMRIHLRNGVCAPVSRHAISTLRAAGWLDRIDQKSPHIGPAQGVFDKR